MTTTASSTLRQAAGGARGFTLVELMVAMAIALFLLGGFAMLLQNTRAQNVNQQKLAMLQDEQRFAMTVLTDVIQQGGYYYSGPLGGQDATQTSALTAVGAFAGGQAFYGTHSGAYPTTPDTLTVRYQTTGGDGVIMCDGSTNAGGPLLETNAFTVVAPAGNTPGQLLCSLNGAAAVPLVDGVQSLEVFYGVNRNAPTSNYNVDTYLTADQMDAAGPVGGDWMNISSVRIVLTFTNPLCATPATCEPGQLATLTFERVVPVMGRAGFHS